MPAVITYNAGASYRIGDYRFTKNVGQTVSDEEVIRRAETTRGFTVRREEDPDDPNLARRPKKKRTLRTKKSKKAPRRKKKVLKAKK